MICVEGNLRSSP